MPPFMIHSGIFCQTQVYLTLMTDYGTAEQNDWAPNIVVNLWWARYGYRSLHRRWGVWRKSS